MNEENTNDALIMPDNMNVDESTKQESIPSTLSPGEARQLLETSTELKNQPELPEEIETPADKKALLPIFWLVGILSVLAIGILVAWLLAK